MRPGPGVSGPSSQTASSGASTMADVASLRDEPRDKERLSNSRDMDRSGLSG